MGVCRSIKKHIVQKSTKAESNNKRFLTLDTVRGMLKSLPPCSLKPQGAGPLRVTEYTFIALEKTKEEMVFSLVRKAGRSFRGHVSFSASSKQPSCWLSAIVPTKHTCSVQKRALKRVSFFQRCCRDTTDYNTDSYMQLLLRLCHNLRVTFIQRPGSECNKVYYHANITAENISIINLLDNKTSNYSDGKLVTQSTTILHLAELNKNTASQNLLELFNNLTTYLQVENHENNVTRVIYWHRMA